MMRTRKKLLVQSLAILFHKPLMPCLSYFFKLLGDYLNFEHVKHGFFGRDISLVSFRLVHIPQL